MNQNIILAPVLSEKSATYQETERKYAFKVEQSANKIDIKKAIEARFDVKVEKVATMNMNGKVKRSTMRSGGRVIRTEGPRASWKKAVVTLKAGESIDFFRDEQA
ncbi:MAG: 50S ribosomal protein L23 [Candidatus Marinimicrobia bacterium]|nr:50S ribosomal protein L23 [Candidatus Neomarinimicrobiota bacterium]MCF7851504.1 50S ribosomal protein L23 [Candidatus Neomarinimicrobiota bacterium]